MLRAAATCGDAWGEPHVSLVAALVEAAGEALDEVRG